MAKDNVGYTENVPLSADTRATAIASNNPPTLNQPIIDQSATEDTTFNFTIPATTFNDIDTDDSLTYTAALKNGNDLPPWLKFNAITRTFSGKPAKSDLGSLEVVIRATDKSGASVTDTFLLNVLNVEPSIKLTQISDDIFNISNSNGNAKLNVTLNGQGSNLVNELGVFTVDDAQGRINRIAPNAAGYAQAALERSKVIFSAISNLPNGFNSNNLSSLLELTSGSNLRFYLVRNGSTDGVRSGTVPLTSLLFSDPSKQKVINLGTDSLSLAWKDPNGNSNEFKDLIVTIQSTDEALAIGTNLQGNFQGEVIDLRSASKPVRADFTVNREAAFNNFVGFYQVADKKGGIDTNGDGTADILVGQSGYIQAAISRRVAGIDLSVSNQGTARFTGTFQSSSIFAPFIIVNGTPDALLDSNPNNDPAVYFPYLGANSDGVDHIRLLANNTFGFEDLAGGGDRDFNDIIVKANLTAVK